jgi:biofilm PGA synthesis N-glycosyltransferase PgaC
MPDRPPSRLATLLFAGSLALVAYVFAGYPALVALLARVRPRPPRASPDHCPMLSLIVVARNEQDVIEAKLDNAARLEYPRDRLEVIVVTDGSDDATPDRAGAHGTARVLHRPERAGKLAAMNRAAATAGGEILVFSDANNMYSPNALRELAAPFADPEVGIVTGQKAIDDGTGRPLDRSESLYWRYESRLKHWESSMGSVSAAAGEILAFRREAYVSPESGTLNEDLVQILLAAASGWRIVYAPAAVSMEVASATTRDEASRRARLVAGRWQAVWRVLPVLARRDPLFAWQFASHKAARPLIPWALLLAGASNLALTGGRRWARWIAGVQAGFYATAAIGWRRERAGRRDRLTYLPYYFCRMNLSAIAGLGRLLRGRQSAVWDRVPRG